jgi:hypothetical protein
MDARVKPGHDEFCRDGISSPNTPLHSRDAVRPSFALELPALLKQRAQGMPDARCTRDLMCNVHKKVRT